jgi:hypothetical protein
MAPSARRHRAGRAATSRGQALVEFAFVAPLVFLVVVGIFEGARYVFFQQVLNRAAQEGARYAIVHGADSTCPSGPMPEGKTNPCDAGGDHVKGAVREAALGIAGVGDIVVFDPVWTARGSISPPQPGDTSTGHNGRGEYVTVFVDFSFEPIFKQMLDTSFIPDLFIRAESTLVVNN